MMKRKAILRFAAFAALSGLAAAATAFSGEEDLTRSNLVIVLDASLSMNSAMRGEAIEGMDLPKSSRAVLGVFGRRVATRMDVAKAALLEVMAEPPADTNVGLLVFSSVNLRNDWAYPLGTPDRDRLKAAIVLPRPGGRTPLGAYIKKAADRLLEQRASQKGFGTYRMLIVTDGQATDPSLMDRYVPEVIGRGVGIDVIGVAMSTRHTLASNVHSYRSADDPASLAKALTAVISEMGKEGLDAVTEEAFEQNAGIPDGVAAAMLKALCDTQNRNQPIGEKPKRAP